MLKIKETKLAATFVIAGLMILPIVLGACSTDSHTAEIPFGQKEEATNDIAIDEGSEGSAEAAASIDESADSLSAETTSQLEPVAVGLTGSGGQARVADRSQHFFDPSTAEELTAAEIDGLTFMREEEKLARDVYLVLYEQWGMPVFQNIAGSEQAHMDSILMLLEQYGISDPAAGKDMGEFSNPDLQSLYEQLVEQGRVSQADALKVGAAIEELDIMDLEERLAQTNNEFIIQVYTNLLAGSENHLRAFISNLERQIGEIYQPIYLDQDAYDTIMSGALGQGSGGYRGGGNGGSGNGRGQGGNGGAGGSGFGGRNGRGGGA